MSHTQKRNLVPKIQLLRALLLMLASSVLPYACLNAAFDNTPPSTGAYDSGNYRNLFAEIGKSNITSKVDGMFNKMFYGNSNEKLYYKYDSDEYYILDTGSSDIRSEGQSWGMMIAVQMNKKTEFDRLWRFAYNRMRQSNGTFAWQLSTSGQVLDSGSAPDGEEYMAAALFCAAYRWGNGSGIMHYENQANDLLSAMKSHLFNSSSNQVVFSPNGSSYNYTDPSYHLPAFYEYWADVASNNNSYWSTVAATSRDFLQNHLNPVNGLSTYLADFDGTPKNSGLGFTPHVPGDIYMADAWRVAMNIGMDAHIFGAATWHKNASDDVQYFFRNTEGFNSNGICGNGYSQYYNYNGTDWGSCNSSNYRHDQGQDATNAIASFAATNTTIATDYLNQLWNASWPTGQYRYYSGCLHMLGLLQASGQFKLYQPATSRAPRRIEIRAYGTSGAESIQLKINGSVIKTWTMQTSTKSYVYNNYTGGNIQISYTNDAAGRDLRILHMKVGDITHQTEDQYSNTGVWQNGSCGGSYSEWMHCNGTITFGDL